MAAGRLPLVDAIAARMARAPGNQELKGAKFSRKQIGAITAAPYLAKNSSNEADSCSELAIRPLKLASV